jgi:proline racemase
MRWSRTISVADMHCEGTPARIVTGGVLPPPGDTVQQQMVHMRDHDDWLRRFLLNEPRGAGISSANLIVPPKHPDADAGYIIMETVEYPPMSGSNTVSVAAALIELGILPMAGHEARFTLEAPVGLIPIHARRDEAGALEIEFTNQPAFVLALDQPLEVDGLGTITVDVAYGGMFFAIADAHGLGFSVTPDEGRDIVAEGMKITRAAIEQIEAVHPTEPEFHGISIAQIACAITESPDGGKTSRNACVVQPGRIDRSPTGTGTCARLAVMRARGQIDMGERFDNRSIIDTRFIGRVIEETTVGDLPAVIPTINGRAWLAGLIQYGIDPSDPFPEGFRLDD